LTVKIYKNKQMKKILFSVLIISVFVSCKHQQKANSEVKPVPLILVSKDYKNTHKKWLSNSVGNHNFKCVNMYAVKSKDSVNLLLKKADGIIIAGGEDINPSLYGKENERNRCGTINSHRDSLEQMMINYAVKNKVPLLGICRGHQMLNVTEGGRLIIDIPEDTGSKYVHRDSRKAAEHKSTAVYHEVYIKRNTFLYNMVKVDSGSVYSNHHQAVEKIAPGFKITAFAKDKIIEAIEPADTLQHPFILGVQWHPEAMDAKNPLSGTIGRKFMNKVKQHFVID